MIYLDHIVIPAPSLAEGIEYVYDILGIEPGNENFHFDMATSNRRIKLGADVYLEVVAVNEGLGSPAFPRWFYLSNIDLVREFWRKGQHVLCWVARTQHLDVLTRRYRHIFGEKTFIDNSFHFALPPGSLPPWGGGLPYIIESEDVGTTADTLQDDGFELVDFKIMHPDYTIITDLFSEIQFTRAPKILEHKSIEFEVTVKKPNGRCVVIR